MIGWRRIEHKKIVCVGCGVTQKDMDDNSHLSWCSSHTDEEDGPKKIVHLPELTKL